MVPTPAALARGARLLDVDDVERVIAIDHAHTGRTRRHFFEKRFAAAHARPDEFIHVGIASAGALRVSRLPASCAASLAAIMRLRCSTPSASSRRARSAGSARR